MLLGHPIAFAKHPEKLLWSLECCPPSRQGGVKQYYPPSVSQTLHLSRTLLAASTPCHPPTEKLGQAPHRHAHPNHALSSHSQSPTLFLGKVPPHSACKLPAVPSHVAISTSVAICSLNLFESAQSKLFLVCVYLALDTKQSIYPPRSFSRKLSKWNVSLQFWASSL